MKDLIAKLTAKALDAKSRTILVFLGALFFVGIVIAMANMGSQPSLDSAVERSSVTAVGKKVDSTPGLSKTSEEYNKLRYQKNAEVAQEAARAGRSAVPTIVSDQVVSETNKQDLIKLEQERLAREREAAYQKLLEKRRQEEQATLKQQTNQQQTAQVTARQQGFEKLMESHASRLFGQWANVPRQQKVGGGETAAADTQATTSATTTDTATDSSSQILYKAGDITFAVLETTVNSDEVGPVMARIVQGPLKGSKIIGNFATAGIDAEKLTLNFNVLNVPSLPRSKSFNAVAIDTETARTALASEVNHHYLLRYGSMFGSAFLEGMSSAVLAALSTPNLETDENGRILGSSVTASTRDQVIAGLGNIGKTIGSSTNFFNRAVTVKLQAGTGFGLLMLSDLDLEGNLSSGYQAPVQAAPATQNNTTSATSPLSTSNLGAQFTNTPQSAAFTAALQDALRSQGASTVGQ